MKTSSAVSVLDSQASASAAVPEAFGFGPFRVLTGLDLLYRGDDVVPLEPRAVCVLRHLVRHAGRVVGKEELLDAVWPATYVTEGVLKKAVSQIRRALADPPQQSRLIETWHRRGYRFIAPVEPADAATPPPAPAWGDELGLDSVTLLASMADRAASELSSLRLTLRRYSEAIRLLETAAAERPAGGAPQGHRTVTKASGPDSPTTPSSFSKGGDAMTSQTTLRRRLQTGAFLTGFLVAGLGLAATPAKAQIDPGMMPVAGTWTTDGHVSVAWVDLAAWTLVTSSKGAPLSVLFDPEPDPWVPVAGDWDGDGVDTIQMFNIHDWRLIPAEKGPVESAFGPDPVPWVPVAGDWDGDGRDTVLVFDQRDSSLHRLEEGPGKVVGFDPEPDPWIPVAGDWDGDRIDTLATFRRQESRESTKTAWTFLSGDWDGDGIDTDAALYLPSGELVFPEKEEAALSSSAATSGSIGSLFAEGGGGAACYSWITDWSQSIHVYHYGGGGCMVLVFTNWTEWSCCKISQNGGDYGCGSQLKMKVKSYGYSNC